MNTHADTRPDAQAHAAHTHAGADAHTHPDAHADAHRLRDPLRDFAGERLAVSSLSPYALRNRAKTVPLEEILASWRRLSYFYYHRLYELGTVVNSALLLSVRTPEKWAVFHAGEELVEKRLRLSEESVTPRAALASFLRDESVETATLGIDTTVFSVLKRAHGRFSATSLACLSKTEVSADDLAKRALVLFKQPASFAACDLHSIDAIALGALPVLERDDSLAIDLPRSTREGSNVTLATLCGVSGATLRYTRSELRDASVDFDSEHSTAEYLAGAVAALRASACDYLEIEAVQSSFPLLTVCLRKVGDDVFILASTNDSGEYSVVRSVERIAHCMRKLQKAEKAR